MYGFWRLGTMPAPSGGAAWVSNGLAMPTTRKAKKTATPPISGVTQGTRAGERGDEDGGRDGGGCKRGQERVLGGEREAAATRERGVAARGRGVEGEAEGDEECGPAELRHSRGRASARTSTGTSSRASP